MFRKAATSMLLSGAGVARATAIRTTPRLAIPAVSNAAVGVQKRGYHEKVLDHYSNPRNVGSMSKDDIDVGTGLVGAPACKFIPLPLSISNMHLFMTAVVTPNCYRMTS